MNIPKIAAMFSIVIAMFSHGAAQSAPLNSLSAVVKAGADQNDAVQVRWHRGWYGGGASVGAWGPPPHYYGGSNFRYTYGGFPGPYGHGYVFPTYNYGYRPYGWFRAY